MSKSEVIHLIRDHFNLIGYWEEMPDDLITLAITHHGKVSNVIQRKYKTHDGQSLEYYGDRVLYILMAQMFMTEIFGLNVSPSILTKNQASFNSNKQFNNIMNYYGLCNRLVHMYYGRGKKLNVTDRKIKQCADMFESIVGAMYYYGLVIKNDPMIYQELYNWYKNVEPLNSMIKILIYKYTENTRYKLESEVDWDKIGGALDDDAMLENVLDSFDLINVPNVYIFNSQPPKYVRINEGNTLCDAVSRAFNEWDLGTAMYNGDSNFGFIEFKLNTNISFYGTAINNKEEACKELLIQLIQYGYIVLRGPDSNIIDINSPLLH